MLNFGHTVGHALERGAEAWGMGHGAAVALGMLAETRWAEARGWTPPGTADNLARLLAGVGLPERVGEMDWDRARAALAADKKLRAGKLALPVLREVGAVELRPEVTLAEMEQALDGLREA